MSKTAVRVDYAGVPFECTGEYSPPEASVGYRGAFELSRISVYNSWHDLYDLLSAEQVAAIEQLAFEKLTY